MRIQKGWNSRMVNTNHVPSQSNSKSMKQKCANLGGDMASFGSPNKHTNMCILSNTFFVYAQVTSNTAWQTEEGNPPLCSTHLLAAKVLKVLMVDSWVPNLLKHPQQDLTIGNQWRIYASHWELYEAKAPQSNKVQLEVEVWIDLWDILSETWTH